MLFPSLRNAERCRAFLLDKCGEQTRARIVELHDVQDSLHGPLKDVPHSSLCIILFPKDCWSIAKAYWQHTGEGISSRLADHYLRVTENYAPEKDAETQPTKPNGRNRHYSRRSTTDAVMPPTDRASKASGDAESINRDQLVYIDERYGRNLNAVYATQAKLAVRKRIAGILKADVELEEALKVSADGSRIAGLHEDDVYLYGTGMTSIFNAHRISMNVLGPYKSACFGFPYTDTLKILQKWGPGAHFFGRGDQGDLVALEQLLKSGEKVLALFCECPSNPLLRTPDLRRLRELADIYGFVIVVDETIGNFLNVQVLSLADIVVSSLTKVFSGDSNVMGGAFILNPNGQYYAKFKEAMKTEYEDTFWPEDAITLERNSRDFVKRIQRINVNAEIICGVLKHHPKSDSYNFMISY